MDAQTARKMLEEITLPEAADYLPRRAKGRKVHVKTLRRWITKGCRGVFLKARPAGGAWYTTRAAIDDFRNQLASRAIRQPGAVEIPSPAAQTKLRDRSRQRLLEKGFKLDEHNQNQAQGGPVPVLPQAT